MSASPPAIQTQTLGMTYRPQAGPVTVFENLNITIQPGQRVALVGPSGAGKSTILHLLGGLDRPTKGTVHLHGRDITTLNDRDLADLRNREIGFVWQNASLLPEFTAIENVMMPLLIRGTKPNDASDKAAIKLIEVGLGHRKDHRAGELSGGEQQRVSLARALVGEPKFLFADEPTGSLDYRTGNQMIDLLAELHQKHGLTSVYVTHNDHFAHRCDRILELDQGVLRELPGH